jgi:hypothetical protein
MNRQDVLTKINYLGLTTTPEVVNQISDMVSKLAGDTVLSSGETETLTNVMILKSCDTALLDKRTIVNLSDVLSWKLQVNILSTLNK